MVEVDNQMSSRTPRVEVVDVVEMENESGFEPMVQCSCFGECMLGLQDNLVQLRELAEIHFGQTQLEVLKEYGEEMGLMTR